MADMHVVVGQNSVGAAADGTWPGWKGNRLGFGIVIDFYTEMAMEGRVYQVRAGTVTSPLTGDEAITDTAAEMAADCVLGTTIMPVSASITIDAAGGDAFESAGKSVATVSSSGTAFVPLNLKSGGAAASSTARVQAAGAVTVTAELATTTLRHFAWSSEFVQDAGTEAGTYTHPYVWQPRVPPVLVGPRSFYIQIASATTGPVYFAHFDYIELPSTAVA